jgi:hypothetical protein
MGSKPFEELLLEATPQARRGLLARLPGSVGEREVDALAARARAAAEPSRRRASGSPTSPASCWQKHWEGSGGGRLALWARAAALREDKMGEVGEGMRSGRI